MIWPSLVTSIGYMLGAAGSVGYPSRWAGPLLAVSLICDFVDGKLARALDAASVSGAELDWAVDCALCALLAGRALSPTVAVIYVLAAVLMQVHTRVSDGSKRVSGRTAIFAYALWRLL